MRKTVIVSGHWRQWSNGETWLYILGFSRIAQRKRNKPFLVFLLLATDTMDWMWGLIHVRQVAYHWDETPAQLLNFYIETGFKLSNLEFIISCLSFWNNWGYMPVIQGLTGYVFLTFCCLKSEFKIIFLHSSIAFLRFS